MFAKNLHGTLKKLTRKTLGKYFLNFCLISIDEITVLSKKAVAAMENLTKVAPSFEWKALPHAAAVLGRWIKHAATARNSRHLTRFVSQRKQTRTHKEKKENTPFHQNVMATLLLLVRSTTALVIQRTTHINIRRIYLNPGVSRRRN